MNCVSGYLKEFMQKKKLFLVLLCAVIFSAFCFSSSLNNYFTADDTCWIRQAMHINDKGVHSFSDFFIGGFFRPFTTFVFWINFHLFRLVPSGYYFANLFFYIINVFLVYYLTKNIAQFILPLKADRVAFFTALFFLMIPTNHEIIVFISDIHDALCLFFALLCCLFFIYFLKNNNRIFYILSLVFSLLSVLAKESGFVLPVMIVLLACLLRYEEKKWLYVLKVFLPYGVLIGLYFILYQLLLKKLGGDYRLGKHFASTLIFYLYSFPSSLFFINKNMVMTLATFKTMDRMTYLQVLCLWIAQSALMVVGACILIIVGFMIFKKRFKLQGGYSKNGFLKLFNTGGAWLALSLFPISLMARLVIDSPVAVTRYLYFPSPGFCIILGVMLAFLYDNLNAEKNPVHRFIVPAFIIILLFKSMLMFLVTEKTFELKGDINAYYISTIGQTLVRSSVQNDKKDVFLMDAPGIVKMLLWVGLGDGVYDFYRNDIRIYWMSSEEVRRVLLRNKVLTTKGYFFQCRGAFLSDVTKEYRNAF